MITKKQEILRTTVSPLSTSLSIATVMVPGMRYTLFYTSYPFTKSCRTFNQFPIMPDGSIYTSSEDDYQSPGTDRVIFTEDGTYCA